MDGRRTDVWFGVAKKTFRLVIRPASFVPRNQRISAEVAQAIIEALAKISGHKDVKILLNTYYNPQGEDLAGLLD